MLVCESAREGESEGALCSAPFPLPPLHLDQCSSPFLLALADLPCIQFASWQANIFRLIGTKNSNFGRYEDYRSKGKYSADLLWERNHRLKSEEENRKTWEQIKKDAASRMPDDSSNKWSLASLCQNTDRDG